MPITHSPLRYPGGKAQLKPFIKELLSTIEVKTLTYIEPFSGGAGLALSLLFDGTASKIILNDYDKAIYSLWHCIVYNSEDLITKIIDTPVTIDEWHIQKGIYEQKEETDVVELAFATLFLNRTNRSGILKAGVIGGKEQKGNYKLDCRFNKRGLIDKIKKISLSADCIELHNLDAVEFIEKVIKKQDKNCCFIFFDPPYYNKGKELYTNFFDKEDHENLFIKINALKDYNWIVTYDNCQEIIELYKEHHPRIYSLNYSLATKKKATELLFVSKGIDIPANIKNLNFEKPATFEIK
ncbi:DNA adenine methylase [Erwinia sp. S63]|uniref:DNA adenine methylase n=1 Tax=Erwinia sp. S63 TaxID=2769341 RepID=UPI001909FF21|nr:DNA adenine methylase [Erwinia sp. S63]MBK0097466.1 DNA adenine methylase [Erwinia sp. S63]